MAGHPSFAARLVLHHDSLSWFSGRNAVKRRIQYRIPLEHAGALVLDLLAHRFPYHTREQWAVRVAEGLTRVNGAAVGAEQMLGPGDVLEYIAPDVSEPMVDTNLQVLHDDSDIMVINKPPNLPCHPAGRYFDHTLWAELRRRFGIESPAFVNRIDRETSGLVVVARNDRAAKSCRTQFARRRVTKRYVVLVEGHFPDSLEACGQLVPDSAFGRHKRRLFLSECGGDTGTLGMTAGAERAETFFRRLGDHEGISVVEAVPRTGRLHQIRATLCSLGFPVVGDKLYGPDPALFVRFCTDMLSDADWRLLRMKRQALHAAHLQFRHPQGGRHLQFEAPLPGDMLALMGAGRQSPS